MTYKHVNVIGAVLAVALFCLVSAPRVAAANVACDTLIVTQSEDKNYFSFTAQASAANQEQISGFSFDFGDNQKYSFVFGSAASDHTQATVKHTYETQGRFNASVVVNTSANGTAQSVGDDACKVVVINAETPEILPNTGPNVLVWFGMATIAGAALHRLHRRFRAC